MIQAAAPASGSCPPERGGGSRLGGAAGWCDRPAGESDTVMVGGLQASEPLSIATTEGRAAELSEAAVALFLNVGYLTRLKMQL